MFAFLSQKSSPRDNGVSSTLPPSHQNLSESASLLRGPQFWPEPRVTRGQVSGPEPGSTHSSATITQISRWRCRPL